MDDKSKDQDVTPQNQQSAATTDAPASKDGLAAGSVSSRGSSTAPYRSQSRGTTNAGASKSLLVALVFMASLATGFLGGWLGASSQNSGVNTSSTAMQRQIVDGEGELISSIAEDVGPSVVSINVVSTNPVSGTDIFGFPVESERRQEGAGTGIIISSEGLVVTNRHVVPAGDTDITVTLSDGTELEDVSVVGRTNESDSLDVAFLKINDREGNDLTAASIGDSGEVEVGDTVVAIGNALGQFNNTVTSGIISGYGRSVQASSGRGGDVDTLTDLFQTDAAINQGNSGGPLVNADGQVIGINTAVAGQGQNIGFAIPINDVKGLIKQVLNTGKFERPYLGVRYVQISPQNADELEVDVEQGAYITPSSEGGASSVLENSPADKAGLREGDVITAVGGTKIDDSNSLASLIGRHAVGENVKIKIIRDGQSRTVDVKLAALPKSTNQ